MKRASYRDAVRWIADNDSSGANLSLHEIAEMISVMLIADIFGITPGKVAIDVCRIRDREGGHER